MTARTLYRSCVTQAQIDAQYNPSLCVADPASEMRHYVERSAHAREALRASLDVPYGPTRAETLDIFPAERSGAPVFVFIHGGYWRSLSSKEFSCVALGLQSLGITTVIPNYALCPDVSIDEITRQMRAAVAWVLRSAGTSAGVHLTAMCLQTRWADDYGLAPDPLRAAVLVSGLFDLEPLRYSYLQAQIQLDDGIIRRNSPVFAVRPCSTPVLITWGDAETEEFARQSRTFHSAWKGAGNASELQAVVGAHHFSAIHGFEIPSSPLCRWVASTLSL